MKDDIIEFSKIFESKVRLQMIVSLTVSDLSYSQLKKICRCTDGNMTTHTKKLEEEGYIKTKKEFKDKKPLTTYHLTSKGKKEFKEYVVFLNKVMEEKYE